MNGSVRFSCCRPNRTARRKIRRSNISAAFIARHRAVSQSRTSDTSNVIGHHAKRNVVPQLRVGRFARVDRQCWSGVKFAGVTSSPLSESLIVANNGVQRSVAKLSLLPWITWQIRSRPMPVSTCCAGSVGQFADGVAVVLDEDEIPDLHHARVFAVDLRTAGAVGRAVDVDFGARAAWVRCRPFPRNYPYRNSGCGRRRCPRLPSRDVAASLSRGIPAVSLPSIATYM